MEVASVNIDRERAAELYREYKAHRHYATPVDDEIRRAYKEIAAGKVVIRALESIKRAGLNEAGLPKLAIARADLPKVCFRSDVRLQTGTFMSEHEQRKYRRTPVDNSARITMPPKSFPGIKDTWRHNAIMPLIPVHLRPRQALNAYYVLWEAEWDPVPPKDPYLLRRIGSADLWLVVAAWDLTDVERAALSTRVAVQ